MTLGQLNNIKSNHATWMLALVIFLSGFTFSAATEYAKADQVKAKTELVVSARAGNKRSIVNTFTHQIFPAEFFPSKVCQVIKSHDKLYKVQFDFINQNYLTFRTYLNYIFFFSRTPKNEFSPLVG